MGNRRRKMVVDGKYQFGQLAFMVAVNVLTVFIVGALLSWFYLIAWDGTVAVNHNQTMPMVLLGGVFFVAVLSACLSLSGSCRVAGMIKKIRIILEDAGQGKFPEKEVAFRKKDPFNEVARPLNICLSRLKNKKEMKPDVSGLLGDLEFIIEGIEKGELEKEGIKNALQMVVRSLGVAGYCGRLKDERK